ncbi:MAG: outer membrane beta-barrel protein [Bacteroidota bacterium]
MKKLLCISAAIFCLLKTETLAQDFSFGFKSGWNTSSVAGYDSKFTIPVLNREVTAQSVSGFTGGAFISYNFLPWLGIQTEAIYAKKGAIYSDEIPIAISDFITFPLPLPIPPSSLKFHSEYTGKYLEVPLLIKFTAPFDFPLKPVFYTGPNFAFLMSKSQNTTYESELFNLIPAGFIDVKSFFPPADFSLKSMDFGWTVGGGAEYELLKSMAIGADVRYTMGFKSAVDSVSFQSSSSFPGAPAQSFSQENPDIRHRSLSIMGTLQYKF